MPSSPLASRSRTSEGAVRPAAGLALVLAMTGCQPSGERPPAATTLGGEATTSASSAPTPSATSGGAAAGSLLAPDVLKKVCDATCGGPMSSINVYRDADGKITRLYRLYGSCSHSPGIYFSADGTQLDLIPERPIVPGSAEAEALAARHTLQTQGLTLSDVVSCSNGRRRDPKPAR